MRPSLFVLSTLAAGGFAFAAEAQNLRHASGYGSDWGYHYYERGAAARRILTGEPAFYESQPEAVITLMTRDGRSLGEADRPEAIAVARALCEQSGRQFNRQAQGFWRSNGGLSFNGACTQW